MNVLIVFLLLLGIGLISYPTISDMYYKWEASCEISQYNQVIEAEKKDYSDLWAAAEEYNRQLAEDGYFSVAVSEDYADYMAQFLNPLGTGMMGYIEIPSINVFIPIYQGTEENVLQAGAAYWLGTSLPTGGESTHCVIIAHNGLVKAKLFTDLDKVKEGDTFSLNILDRILIYEVDQILITDPDDFEPMEIIEGEDIVTLYTCYPYGVNTHRLLVRGHRIEESSETEDMSDENDAIWNKIKIIGGEKLFIVIVFMCIIFFLILVLVIYKKCLGNGRHGRFRKRKQ